MTDKTIINLNISRGAKHLIYVIKSYGKECYPSIDTLCIKADMSKTTLRKYLKELENKGYLIIKPRKSLDNSQLTNQYILNIPKEK